jgi:hypothetical protein
MRSVVTWGLAAAAVGLLAPVAAADACGPSSTAMTMKSASAAAAVERPAGLAATPNLAALGAKNRSTTVSYSGRGNVPSLSVGAQGTSTTSAEPGHNATLRCWNLKNPDCD